MKSTCCEAEVLKPQMLFGGDEIIDLNPVCSECLKIIGEDDLNVERCLSKVVNAVRGM